MGKQTKGKKAENFGKGKVTPVQIAFIVDRYLSDNNFSETRSIFRSEASTLISKSPVREAPKSLLSLGAMLDEYVCLKEQKVMFEQEKCRLDQEKLRVQMLLQGMQNAMNAYNTSTGIPTLPRMSASSAEQSVVTLPQSNPSVKSPAGHPLHKSPVVAPGSIPSNTIMDPTSFSTPIMTNQYTNKRKCSSVAPNAPLVAKKSRSRLPKSQLPEKGTNVNPPQSNVATNSREIVQQFPMNQLSPHDRVSNSSPAQRSSIAKNLFNQSSLSPQANSSCPKTPPLPLSSQSDKSVSPLEMTSAANSTNRTTQQTTPTNCTIISSKTVIMSPYKQKAYYSVERNHCISTSSPVKSSLKRDHVKGRLDFDGSDSPMNSESPVADGNSTPESEKEFDLFDMDLPNLDFNISELLLDFDIDCGAMNYSGQPALNSLTTISGSTQGSGSHDLGSNQVMSEYSSTVTEVFSEKDMNVQGIDSLTAVKSITKSITFSSPAKKTYKSFLDE